MCVYVTVNIAVVSSSTTLPTNILLPAYSMSPPTHTDKKLLVTHTFLGSRQEYKKTPMTDSSKLLDQSLENRECIIGNWFLKT